MKNGFHLLLFSAMLCCLVSGCGKSDPGPAAASGTAGGGGGSSVALKWSTAIQDSAFGGTSGDVTPTFISSPAVAPDGTIYVGSADHFLYALRPNGTVKWKYQTGGNLYASPTVGSDGTIYIGSEDRQFYAINPDGSLKWIFPTRTVFTSSAAIGADGTIYAAGTNQDKTIFFCANKVGACSVTKTTSCTADADCPTGETCVLGNNVVVQLGTIFAINPDGTEKWEFVTNKSGFSGISGLSGVVNSSPAVAGDGTIYIGSEGDSIFDRSNFCDDTSIFPASNADPFVPVNGHLYAINPDGKLKWDFKALGFVDSSPAIGGDGTVYVGSHRTLKLYGKDQSKLADENPTTMGFIYAINSDGTLKWADDLLGDVDSSPAVGSDGTIYVGADNFHVYSLNPANGSINWVKPTKDKVKSSPAIGSDGKIYIGSNDGSLYAFEPDGTLKSQFNEGSTTVNSGPSIGPDGTIYFSSADNKLNALFGNGSLAVSPWPKFRRDLPNTGRE